MHSAVVTGGSGRVGGALIAPLRREGGDVRAPARSERSAAIRRARAQLGRAPVTTIDEGMEELRRAHLGGV